MLKKIQQMIIKRQRQKMIIENELERKKSDFVYRFLLEYHERRLKGKIDLPAFYYASDDMETIKELNKLDEAYKFAKEIYKKIEEKKAV